MDNGSKSQFTVEQRGNRGVKAEAMNVTDLKSQDEKKKIRRDKTIGVKDEILFIKEETETC